MTDQQDDRLEPLRRLVEAGTRIVQMGYAAGGGNVDGIVDSAQAEGRA